MPGSCLGHAYAQCWMMTENPSTQEPQEPEIPAILYPSGGIKVCLRRCQYEPKAHPTRKSLTRNHQRHCHRSQTSSPC